MPSFEKINFPSEKALKEALKKLCNPKCNKCLEQGQTGYDVLKKHWRVCLCVDTAILKQVGDRLCKLAETKEEIKN